MARIEPAPVPNALAYLKAIFKTWTSSWDGYGIHGDVKDNETGGGTRTYALKENGSSKDSSNSVNPGDLVLLGNVTSVSTTETSYSMECPESGGAGTWSENYTLPQLGSNHATTLTITQSEAFGKADNGDGWDRIIGRAYYVHGRVGGVWAKLMCRGPDMTVYPEEGDPYQVEVWNTVGSWPSGGFGSGRSNGLLTFQGTVNRDWARDGYYHLKFYIETQDQTYASYSSLYYVAPA